VRVSGRPGNRLIPGTLNTGTVVTALGVSLAVDPGAGLTLLGAGESLAAGALGALGAADAGLLGAADGGLLGAAVGATVATGDGVAVGTGVGVGAAANAQVDAGAVMMLLSRVTAPVLASARPPRLSPPTPMVAPVFMVMLAIAMMVPWKSVVLPSVAELPTCQNTAHAPAPLINDTDELDAVVSVLPIWKMKVAFVLPWPSRVRVPVS